MLLDVQSAPTSSTVPSPTELAATLWPRAAATIGALERPADWAEATGLPDNDFPPVAAIIQAVLSVSAENPHPCHAGRADLGRPPSEPSSTHDASWRPGAQRRHSGDAGAAALRRPDRRLGNGGRRRQPGQGSRPRRGAHARHAAGPRWRPAPSSASARSKQLRTRIASPTCCRKWKRAPPTAPIANAISSGFAARRTYCAKAASRGQHRMSS